MLIYSADVVIEAIGDDYDDLVGRDPTPAETALYLASYRTDPLLDDIRANIARTPDARAALAGVYRDTLDSEPSPTQLDALQQSLVNGATLDDVEATLSASLPPDDGGSAGDDTRVAIDGLYQAVLGRDGDDAGVDYWQSFVARGGTVAEVRVALATSDETRGVVGALYRDVLGRAGDAAGIAYWQDDLAGGRSIDDVRANLAGSDEAGQAVGALYEAVLGRDGDAPGIAYWQGELAGSLSLDDVRTDLASSDEVGQAVGTLYEAVLGRDGDAPGIAYWQQRMIDGSDLDDIRQALAASSEVADDLGSATLAATGAPLGTDALAGYVARLSEGTADLEGLRSEIAAPAGPSAAVAVAVNSITLGADNTLVFVPSVQPATLVATAQPETFIVAGLQAAVVIQRFDPTADVLQFSATQFTDATAVRTAFAMTLAGARLTDAQGGTLLLAGQSDVSTLTIKVF